MDAISHYLQGGLSDDQAEQLEDHVQECSDCLEALSAAAARNPFFQAAFSTGQYTRVREASVVELAALRTRLKGSAATSEAPSRETLTDSPPAADTKDPIRAGGEGDLVGPAQSEGELGRLEHYRILEELGHGGMGVVFRAEDIRLGRDVAVKVMRREFARDAGARARFLREARSAAAVEHENIVAIYHVGEQGDIPYFVMPLLRGQSLDKRLRHEAPLTLAESIRIGRDVAIGLAAAHARGLIHRDIKPSNIWLEDRPKAPIKILDFGLARQEEGAVAPAEPVTRPGAIVGTPEYMSPEQARGETVDARSDLYSLGVLLYRLTAGRLPFTATTVSGYAVAHATQVPRDIQEVNPALPPLLAKTIMQLLEKDPARRPVSAQTLAETLGRLLEPDAALTQPYLQTTTRTPNWKNRWPLIAATVVGVALLVGAPLWLLRDRDPPRPEPTGPVLAKQPVRIKLLRVLHYALVKEADEERTEPRGALGDKSFEAKYNDGVKIMLELTAPAHAYLLAFNANGSEQVLWPVGADLKPSESEAPPLVNHVKYPARPGKEFALDDDANGGLQVFAAVVSSAPLPTYAAWKKARGAATWKKLPPGHGVWASDGDGVYPITAGQIMRGGERDLPNAPPLTDLCRSLRQGGRDLVVEALAFPVRAKE